MDDYITFYLQIFVIKSVNYKKRMFAKQMRYKISSKIYKKNSPKRQQTNSKHRHKDKIKDEARKLENPSNYHYNVSSYEDQDSFNKRSN